MLKRHLILFWVLILSGFLLLPQSELFAVELGENDFRISHAGPDNSPIFSLNNPVVAYNSTDNEYLVAWYGEDDADLEIEIYGQRVDAATGAPIDGVFRISDMGPSFPTAGFQNFEAQELAIAYNSADNEYLVVWAADDDSGAILNGEYEIYGQRIDANPATFGEVGTNDFRISDMGTTDGVGNFDARRPDVAYNSSDNEYLVVWEGDDDTAPLVDFESEIFGQLLNNTGGEISGDFRISHMGVDGVVSAGAVRPAIAHNSNDNRYLVVWDGDDGAPLADDEEEIWGQLLAANGATVGGDFRISDMGPDFDANFGAFEAAVAYNPDANEFLVVWQGDDNSPPLGDAETEIFGQRLDATNGSELGVNDFRISDMGPDSGPDETNFAALVPSITYNSINQEYLVTWHGDDDTAPLADNNFQVFGQRLAGASGNEIDGDFVLSQMDPTAGISNSYSAYNSTNNETLVVWSSFKDFAPPDTVEEEVFGQRFAEAACGNGFFDEAAGEVCEDGNTSDDDGCTNNCALPSCGDGIVQSGEACDDGAANSDSDADACRTNCLAAACSDGVTDDGETCDDGNANSGDGCSSLCQSEGSTSGTSNGGCSLSSPVETKVPIGWLIFLIPLLAMSAWKFRRLGGE